MAPRLLSVVLSLLLCSQAQALDLKTAFETAMTYDAELLAAQSARDEVVEGVGVARAPLLPQVNYSYQRNKAETLTHYIDSKLADNDSGRYNSGSANFTIRQALFRLPAWYAFKGAQVQAEASEETFRFEGQRAGMRAASHYFEVLSARATLEQVQSHLQSMEAWLELAEKAFKAGRGTRTDIEDARSRRDLAKAKETEARMLLSAAGESFQVVTGLDAEGIDDATAFRLDEEGARLAGAREEWLQRVEETNPELQALRKQLEATELSVSQMRSGHLPTLDLVAAEQRGRSETHTTVGSQYTTDYVGVQVNIPLFSGGSTSAQTSQARARAERVRQTLESTRRKALAEASRLLLAVEQGIELVQALRQAVLSAEDATVGEKKGLQAGTRTLVDVLDAERRLAEARREQAVSMFALANNRLKFLALSGGVNQESIGAMNGWLATARP